MSANIINFKNRLLRKASSVIIHFKTTTMRIILTLIISFFTLTTFGQQMTSEQWEEEAKTNIRLLPKYGHVEKTEAQKKSDQEFIEGQCI
jgi:hypothetical protein